MDDLNDTQVHGSRLLAEPPPADPRGVRPTYLIVVGGVVVLVGLLATAIERDTSLTGAGGGYAALFGLLWAAGVGCIAVALGEWQTVQPGRLLLATGLIIGGGVLAASSAR